MKQTRQQIRDVMEIKLADLSALEEAEALRIGRIAIAAGLADKKIGVRDLKARFRQMADDFPSRRSGKLVAARKAARKGQVDGS